MQNKIKRFINDVNRRVPYIPDFGNYLTIFRVFIVSLFLSTIYTFSQLEKSSDFYIKIIPSTKVVLPYLALQLFLLIIFSKFINKIKPLYAVFVIVFLNLVSVYFVYANTHGDYSFLVNDYTDALDEFLVSLSILFFFLLYFDWKQKNIDPENTKAKLIYLQSKMRPHFLFNTMNTVISLIKSKPEIAKKMLLNLSELLRVSINEDDITSMYPLDKEILLCEKYLEIEKIRLGDRLNIKWDIDKDVLSTNVPKLFLQPIIENSVLHGIQNIAEGGLITISIRKNILNKIVIEIMNPINLNNDNKSNNISLKNIKERLMLYYDNNILYENTIINNNYCVLIEIPI